VNAKDYFTQSVESGQRAVALDASNTLYRTNLARALATLGERFGDADSAAKASQQYLELADAESDPLKKVPLLVKSADALFDSGLTNKSVAAFRAVLQIDAEDLDAMHRLAQCLVAGGDASIASEALQLEQTVAQKAPEGSRMKHEAVFLVKKLSHASPSPVPAKTPAPGTPPAALP
jgi:tetratricopeptide (TPR) repeat protein